MGFRRRELECLSPLQLGIISRVASSEAMDPSALRGPGAISQRQNAELEFEASAARCVLCLSRAPSAVLLPCT